ncbi:MAG TPA: sialate O-acetylesterase [Planctomycetota bacterium]|nr:sialate O-acetylesterase [Planctomycetota bacterium]HRR81627.1 sialate O-acetylesterase [Planctomycetota bacterium]HRT97549.1 sialate O-acetylesterase [Planctomycetota bacterium]
MPRPPVVAFTLALCVASARADVRLPKVFTDHMVLQQEMPIAVWGRATTGELVTVEFNGQRATAKAGDDGAWRVTLPAMKADGQPHSLVVKGNNSLELKDVLLGEVWLCAGQSNMGRPVDEAAAKAADQPQIRLFNSSGETPRADGLDETSGWIVCTPTSILQAGDFLGAGKGRRPFSEVAYHFGLKLHQTLKVPVGLIQANCGGSTARDWTPFPEAGAKLPLDQPIPKITHSDGQLYWVRLRGMVPFAVRGVVWYQGEDDGRNPKYAEDFKALIESWRKLWDRPDLPFYFAQIAATTYAGGMLGVWEAQQWVMNHVPHTGMAVSNDIYEGTTNGGFKRRDDKALGWPIAGGSNPHPTGKPRIAARLAEIALVETYGQPKKVLYGPMYASHEARDGKIVVRFKHTGSGLATDDGQPPNWFEVSDGTLEGNRPRYVKAEARIVGPDTVEVSSPLVAQPKFVRFGWHALARYNLINKEGLPAVSFRAEPGPQR